MRVEHELRVCRFLVRIIDARKVLDLASACLLVESLGIARLGDFQGAMDKHFEKGKTTFSVDFPRCIPASSVRAYEGRDGDGAAVVEEGSNFGNAAQVLLPILCAESETCVETKANVIAIQTVCKNAHLQQAVLEGGPHGRLAATR